MSLSVIRACLAVATFFSVSTGAVADVSQGLKLLEQGQVPEAAKEFQASYEKGEGQGAFYLARLFELGVGVKADMVQAANLYAAAANAAKPSDLAKVRLGDLYVDGTVLLRDYKAAYELYCQAADNGLVEGQLNCGVALQNGQGVVADAAKALTYLEKAAEQGNVVAINLAASAYLEGKGVVADREKARVIFEKGALQGNGRALYELAKLHFEAKEGEADRKIDAYAFANLAVVRNIREAIALRDEMEKSLTSEEILAGQERAKTWTQERLEAASNAAEPDKEKAKQ